MLLPEILRNVAAQFCLLDYKTHSKKSIAELSFLYRTNGAFQEVFLFLQVLRGTIFRFLKN